MIQYLDKYNTTIQQNADILQNWLIVHFIISAVSFIGGLVLLFYMMYLIRITVSGESSVLVDEKGDYMPLILVVITGLIMFLFITANSLDWIYILTVPKIWIMNHYDEIRFLIN